MVYGESNDEKEGTVNGEKSAENSQTAVVVISTGKAVR